MESNVTAFQLTDPVVYLPVESAQRIVSEGVSVVSSQVRVLFSGVEGLQSPNFPFWKEINVTFSQASPVGLHADITLYEIFSVEEAFH